MDIKPPGIKYNVKRGRGWGTGQIPQWWDTTCGFRSLLDAPSPSVPPFVFTDMDKLTVISGCLFLAADIFAIASVANPDWINIGESGGRLRTIRSSPALCFVFCALHVGEVGVTQEKEIYQQPHEMKKFTHCRKISRQQNNCGRLHS